MSSVSPNAVNTAERPISYMVLILAVALAWLRGGTHASLTWITGLLAVAFFLMLVTGYLPGVRPAGAALRWPWIPLIQLRDPLFGLGLLFLCLLAVQWLNAGRSLVFEAGTQSWRYSPPPVPGLPFAFSRAEARQMLEWFFPLWVILLALRAPALSTHSVRRIWRGLAYSGGALALFGLVQFASGATAMYGLVPMRPHFFATFGYPNHAGSYFLLVMCLSAGLLSWEISMGQGRRNVARLSLLSAAFLLGLVGANLALSRLSILASWALVLVLAGVLIRFLWPRLMAVQRLHLVLGSLAVFSLAILLTLGLGREAIRTEFQPEKDNKSFMDRETSFRWFQLQSGLRVWRDHPLFGVGGWGYRYLVATYLPPEQWPRVTEGKANVHNDPVQFLAEFGLVGVGLLGLMLLVLARDLRHRRLAYAPLVVLPLVGVALVGGQSLIDLPFRSPAVLALWLISLAGASRVLPPRREPAPRPANQLNVSPGGDIVPH